MRHVTELPLPTPASWKTSLSPLLRRLRLAGSRARLELARPRPARLNLGAGDQRIPGYFNVDLGGDADLLLDLERSGLPFPGGSVEAVVCMSAINYLTAGSAERLIAETHRVLRPGGVARYGVQDLKKLVALYLARDDAFFGQRGANREERFPGPTRADKLAAWFYGHPTAGGPCRYVYDYESLAHRFASAGFRVVEERAYLSSRLPEVERIDNRPDQMFFLEAVR